MNPLDSAALEPLAVLAGAGGFERAAQSLSITQSAVATARARRCCNPETADPC